MELALEVCHTINCTIVLALSLFVPLNTNPQIIASLRIVFQLAYISNTSNLVLQCDSMSDKLFYIVRVA
jgi:hypothetical protein